MKNYEKLYNKLLKEFEQYKNESIKWSVEDFTWYPKDGWQISKKRAQEALERMCWKHDASLGISWDTISWYIEEYGKEVPEGNESWRAIQQQINQEYDERHDTGTEN